MSQNGATWSQNHFADAVMDIEEEKQVIGSGWERNAKWVEGSPDSKEDTASLGDSCAQDDVEERGMWPDENAFLESEDDPTLHLNPVHGAASDYQYMEFGRPGTLHYRMLFLDDTGKEVSPWHSIPLHGRDGLLTFICKSPAGTWAEYEVAENEEYNPLRILNRRGSPSHFAENTAWNVGFLPETYGDPDQLNEEYGGLALDGKPLEVFDVGSRAGLCGDVYLVQPLAAFAVIEDQRLSWKLVAIAASDVLADRIHTIEDLQAVLPGALEDIRDWLRTYHCLEPEDKEIVFGLNQRPISLDTLLQVVAGAHGAWQLYSSDHPARGGGGRSPLGRDALAYQGLWRKYTVGMSTECTDLSESRATSTLKYERAWSNLSEKDGVQGVGPDLSVAEYGSPSSPLDGGMRVGRGGKGKELLSFLTSTGARKAGEQMMSKLGVGQRRREAGRSSGSVDSIIDRDSLLDEVEGQAKKNIFRGLIPKTRTAQPPDQNPNPDPQAPSGMQEFLAPGGYRMDKVTLKELTLQGTAEVAGSDGGWIVCNEGEGITRSHSPIVPTRSSGLALHRMLSMGSSSAGSKGSGRVLRMPSPTESTHSNRKGRLGRRSADNVVFTQEEDRIHKDNPSPGYGILPYGKFGTWEGDQRRTLSATLASPRVGGGSREGSISAPSPRGGGKWPTQQELADSALPRFENPAPHPSFADQPPRPGIPKSKAPTPFANLSVQVEDLAGQEVETVRGDVPENEGLEGGGTRGRVGMGLDGLVKVSPLIEGGVQSFYTPRTMGKMGQKVEGGGSKMSSGQGFTTPMGGGLGGYELPKMGSAWIISATPRVARVGMGFGHDLVRGGEGVALGAEMEEEVIDEQDVDWNAEFEGEDEEVEEGEDIPVAKAIGMYVRGWDEDGVDWEDGEEGPMKSEPLKKLGRRVSFADRNQVITFMQDDDREVGTRRGL